MTSPTQINLELASGDAPLARWETSKMVEPLQAERAIRRQTQGDMKTNERQTNELETSRIESLKKFITSHQNKELQELRENLQESQNTVSHLSSQVEDLRQQMDINESNQEMEKSKILKALRAEREIRKQTQAAFKKERRTNGQSEKERITILQNKEVQELKKNLRESQKTNIRLSSEVNALKRQMATNESSWQKTVAELQQQIRTLEQRLLDEEDNTLCAYEELSHFTGHQAGLDTDKRSHLTNEWCDEKEAEEEVQVMLENDSEEREEEKQGKKEVTKQKKGKFSWLSRKVRKVCKLWKRSREEE